MASLVYEREIGIVDTLARRSQNLWELSLLLWKNQNIQFSSDTRGKRSLCNQTYQSLFTDQNDKRPLVHKLVLITLKNVNNSADILHTEGNIRDQKTHKDADLPKQWCQFRFPTFDVTAFVAIGICGINLSCAQQWVYFSPIKTKIKSWPF